MPEGRLIAGARVALGLMQKELAELADINKSTLVRLEQGGIDAVKGAIYTRVLAALEKAGAIVDSDKITFTKSPEELRRMLEELRRK